MDYDFFTFFVFEDLLVKSLGKQTTVNHKSLVAQTQDIQKINDPDFQTVRKNKKLGGATCNTHWNGTD